MRPTAHSDKPNIVFQRCVSYVCGVFAAVQFSFFFCSEFGGIEGKMSHHSADVLVFNLLWLWPAGGTRYLTFFSFLSLVALFSNTFTIINYTFCVKRTHKHTHTHTHCPPYLPFNMRFQRGRNPHSDFEGNQLVMIQTLKMNAVSHF